jgi:hypothetical protein
MRKHVIILLFAALCCCSPKENKTGITGEIPSLYLERKLYEFLPISNSFSEYKYIPLKETDDFLIGQVDKLIRTDSSYFIMDRDKTQTIYKYDLEGNPVNKFFHKGGSANEYTEIIDFDVDTASEEIVIFCVMPKIIYTDYNFNIKKTQILGYNYFDRIVSWDKKIYLYNDRHRVLACLDSKMEQPDTLIITK